MSKVTLTVGRHLAGMAVVALANPLIYHGGGIYQWSITFAGALLLAAVGYGLYVLFFTQRAKVGWPKSFFVLAWACLALMLVGNWSNQPTISNISTNGEFSVAPAPVASTEQPQTDRFGGVLVDPGR